MRRAMRLRAMVSFAGQEEDVEPSPPLASLGAWWRADDAGTVDGANVISWTDRSVYAQTLAPLGGVGVPTWQSSVASLGNRPAVNFGSNKGLALSMPGGFLAGSSALSVYAVLEIDSFANTAFFLFGALGSTILGNNFSAIILLGPNRIGTSIYGAHSLTGTTTGAKIVCIRNATGDQWGNSELSINGAFPSVDYGNPTAVINIPSPVASVSVGGGDGAYDFSGRIAEVLYYQKNHDMAERSATLAYLSDRYGISVA